MSYYSQSKDAMLNLISNISRFEINQEFGLGDINIKDSDPLVSRIGFLVSKGVLYKSVDHRKRTGKRWVKIKQLTPEEVDEVCKAYAHEYF
jgi:hypothetical protein